MSEKKQMKTAEELRAEFAPKKTVELYEGLELWFVPVAVLQEQDVNARSMPSDMFLQLTDTIGRDGRLESTPLCALTQKGLELVSGHHRVRAARKADLNEIWVMVDVSGITRDKLRGKQLAHNSISGKDNEDIVRAIFEEIEDLDAKIEAFIEPDLSDLPSAPKLSTKELDATLDAKIVTILFLPSQFAVFKQAMELLIPDTDEVWLATKDEYDMMIESVGAVSEAYEIRSMPTIFAKIAEIVKEHVTSDALPETTDD